MYASTMKRFQILLDEDLDHALEQEARRRRTSKAELLRRLAREALRPMPPLASDPIARMAGRDDFPPGDVDEVVYG
jgi:hypothetical protein